MPCQLHLSACQLVVKVLCRSRPLKSQTQSFLFNFGNGRGHMYKKYSRAVKSPGVELFGVCVAACLCLKRCWARGISSDFEQSIQAQGPGAKPN